MACPSGGSEGRLRSPRSRKRIPTISSGCPTVAGASVERGVYVAGANVDGKDFSFGAINYYSNDVINIFYTEGKYSLALADGYTLKLAAQFSDQRSTGDDLLTGQSFSTHQWGIKGDLNLGAALLTLAYTDTANDTDMRNPWSGIRDTPACR